MRIEWDPQKDLLNRKKHGVSFEEASELFRSGVEYFEMLDETHSTWEDRFLCLGPVRDRLLIVIRTEPQEDVFRILSARSATRREARMYRRLVEGWTG